MLFFYERVYPGAATRLDVELDDIVIGALLSRGMLSGTDNLTGKPTLFRYCGGHVREDVQADGTSSTARHRSVVSGLSMALFGHPLMMLPRIMQHVRENALRVYLAESKTPLSAALRAGLDDEHLVLSEFFGDELVCGDVVDGVLHEDLMGTSFRDGEFDVVITTDVLEHVPDAPRAEREIARILKPGGAYVFTVPLDTMSAADTILAERAGDGTLTFHGPPVYHGDPLRPEGSLAYRVFSVEDLTGRFTAAGCAFTTYRFWSKELGMLGQWNLVNLARKTL